jgi:putative ABC transport system ATP-binding protein
VLSGLDLQVPGSGITVVVGPSGSGKSTLTRLCNRLIDPTHGVIRLWDRDLRDLDVLALRRSVGMVFQRPTVFTGTVRENLAATGVADRQQHLDALADVGLAPTILDQAARTLSGGEAQRVCLVRALLMRPEVLVADEPTASLDEPATLSLEGLVRTIAAHGVPVLWVTHDLAQFERLADHGVVLADGRVAASGTTQALIGVPGGVARLVEAPWDVQAPHDLEEAG